ncbi:MAG: DUF4055 domain-containing protein [Spirochaetaceae bacterium]|jgi:hypothetical protein|nr:DUF4055 domain-containing protein [Spirochaetaceae bacterium]
MPVNTPSGEYKNWQERWNLVRTVVEGEDAVKKSGERALPRPSGQSDEDYKEYLGRARFFDVVSRTCDSFHGLIFSKEPEQAGEAGGAFGEGLKNVDGAGRSLRKFADDIVYDVLQTYWGGILADFPQVSPEQTKAGAPRNAYLKWYTAESVINWQREARGGRLVTTLVVLREDGKKKKDGDIFTLESAERYRALMLDENGGYTQRIYAKDKDGGFADYETIEPRLGGKPLGFIPFWFCPFEEPSKPILLGMSYEAIGMYQDMADYKNSLHYACIPTPVVENMDTPPPDEKTGKERIVRLGSKEMQFFFCDKADVRVKFLSHDGRGLGQVAASIDAALYRIALLGARSLGADKRGIESAETVRLYRSSENGVLSAFAMAMSAQLTAAVKFKSLWSGVPESDYSGWFYNLNTDYDVLDANAEMIGAVIKAREGGDVPRYAVYSILREAKRIPFEWTYEDYLRELSVPDTESAKRIMLAEIAEGVTARHEYRMKFFGESEEAARARAAELEKDSMAID